MSAIWFAFLNLAVWPPSVATHDMIDLWWSCFHGVIPTPSNTYQIQRGHPLVWSQELSVLNLLLLSFPCCCVLFFRSERLTWEKKTRWVEAPSGELWSPAALAMFCLGVSKTDGYSQITQNYIDHFSFKTHGFGLSPCGNRPMKLSRSRYHRT